MADERNRLRGPARLQLPRRTARKSPAVRCCGAAGAAGALTVLTAAAGSLVHTQRRLCRPGRTPATPWSSSSCAAASTGCRPSSRRRPRLPRGPAHDRPPDRRRLLAGRHRSGCTRRWRRCCRCGRRGQAGRRARRRPAEPEPVALRRDGGASRGRRPGRALRTGWLDRMVGLTGRGRPVPGRHRRAPPPRRARSPGPRPSSPWRRSTTFQLPGRGTTTSRSRWRPGAPAPVRRRAAVLSGPALAALATVRTTAG